MSGESYLAGLIGFFIFLVVFLVLLRLPMKLGWFLLEIIAGIIIHILCAISGYLLIKEFSYWYFASLYAFLWFCFFFITSIYSASVSIGIISYLYSQPQYTSSIQDVYQNCILNVFEERIQFLIATGQVQKTNEGYVTTTAGNETARRLRFINDVLGMESQGFYASTPTLLESKGRVDQQ